MTLIPGLERLNNSKNYAKYGVGYNNIFVYLQEAFFLFCKSLLPNLDLSNYVKCKYVFKCNFYSPQIYHSQ